MRTAKSGQSRCLEIERLASDNQVWVHETSAVAVLHPKLLLDRENQFVYVFSSPLSMRLDPFLQLDDYSAEYRYGNSYRYGTNILLTYRYFAPVYFSLLFLVV